MPDRILGEGLVLRPALHGDRERWLELFHDPLELRFGLPAFVPVPQTIEELDERIVRTAEALAAREPGTLVVASESDPNHFLGSLGWRLDAPRLHIADVGYGVHPDARGRGVAKRALRTLTRWLTVDDSGPHLPRVQLEHSIDNLASCRTALAAGFDQEGIRRHFLPLRDETAPGGERRHDVCLHGFVPSEPVSPAADPGHL
jgi:RimJ/RimL family protein N-acetyltransferase